MQKLTLNTIQNTYPDTFTEATQIHENYSGHPNYIPYVVHALFNGLIAPCGSLLENHSLRVSYLTYEFLCYAEVNDPEVHSYLTENKITPSQIALAALIHDLGKSTWPMDMHNGSRVFDPEDRKQALLHPQVGAAILQCTALPDYFDKVISEHHERYDGGGYLKLSGDQISQIALLVGVFDVFDAISDPQRSYNTSQGVYTAMEYLYKNAQSEFGENTIASKAVEYLMRRYENNTLSTPSQQELNNYLQILTSIQNERVVGG